MGSLPFLAIAMGYCHFLAIVPWVHCPLLAIAMVSLPVLGYFPGVRAGLGYCLGFIANSRLLPWVHCRF